jgi:hypothetical protein
MARCLHRSRAASGAPALVAALVACAALTLTAPAGAANLVGGSRQAAIEKAFAAGRTHRGQVIVSVRSSTVSPSWAVVRSVRPERGGRFTGGSHSAKLLSAYFKLVHGAERGGTPPKAVTKDLGQDFKIAVLYTGSGGETVNYTASTPSVCAGGGQNVDQQQVTVAPMSWSVRYVVDLDRLQAAVRSSQGTMLVPAVTFDATGSSVKATEKTSRSTADVGCAGKPTTASCSTVFRAGGPGAGGMLSLSPGAGLEVGVPTRSSGTGECGAENYTLGPSLWDSGATIAQVGKLGLVGGSLPAHPYGRIAVSWPSSSALAADDLIASPCQGAGPGCSDSLRWAGTVQLQPVSTG